MTEQPVIDLDDSFENRNWLRIVGLMRLGKSREEAIAEIKGASASPGPISGHDTAQHGNEGLSNPVETYGKMFGKGFDGLRLVVGEYEAAVQQADSSRLSGIIDQVEKLPGGDDPKVQEQLDAAKLHITGEKLSTSDERKRHHLVEAKRHVMSGIGIMSTLNAITHDNDDDKGTEAEPDADDTGVLGGEAGGTAGGTTSS